MDKNQAYRVTSEDNIFQIVNLSGRTILECRDHGSAQHYVTLLNQAYDLGYKNGFKAARQNSN